ncbi:MAG: hypothetical protein IT458_00620 [Planctomycetes bacterium]|nr:hypothetical protein [Planctomycetota bacterium]
MKVQRSASLLSILLAAGSLSQGLAAQAPLRGTNAFHTAFRANATKRCDANAYLLAYLSLAMYPEYLDLLAPENLNERRLHESPTAFQATFARYTRHLFHDPAAPASAANSAPSYEFVVTPPRGDGYDPEAMVIGDRETVVVVFRGTDRVRGARSEFGYQWNEWIKSDFDVRGIPPGDGLRGKVHAGLWNSLSLIKRQVAEQVVAFGGRQKKVWIAGHSLGAAHAQLFGAYLASRHGITAQGVYAYAAPHPGDTEFVAELDGLFPDQRLQRFDFVDDTVTMLPGLAMGYARAGTRCYYEDLVTYRFDAAERSILEEAKILPSVLGAGMSALDDAIAKDKRFKLDIRGSGMCYHHPTWYVAAAWQQLSVAEKARCPIAPGIPKQTDEGCSVLDIARGRSHKLEDQAKAVVDASTAIVEDAIELVEFNVKSLLANATGTALPEGTYYLRCLKGGRYLDTDGDLATNGAKVNLSKLGESKRDNRFVIRRDGAVGYTIAQGRAFLEVDGNRIFENNAKVQMWEANAFGGHLPNQKWLFYRIKADKYLLVNLASLKALDADDRTATSTDGRVKQWTPISNDPSQVWIVTKA